MDAKVDDILASIRRTVDSDIDTLSGGTASQARGTLMRGALREMRINMGVDTESKASAASEISDLRSRIRQKMAAMEAAPPPRVAQTPATPRSAQRSTAVVPSRSDFSGILSPPSPRPAALRGSMAGQEAADDLRYIPREAPPQWQEPVAADYRQDDPYAQGYGYADDAYQPDYPPQLEAPIMSAQTEAHAETAFRQLSDAFLARATGDRSLEEMTREMLRGMLKQWLDANLPAIVEDMVREEIQRVARRGR